MAWLKSPSSTITGVKKPSRCFTPSGEALGVLSRLAQGSLTQPSPQGRLILWFAKLIVFSQPVSVVTSPAFPARLRQGLLHVSHSTYPFSCSHLTLTFTFSTECNTIHRH